MTRINGLTGRQLIGATGALVIAGFLITGFEGRVNHVYPDPVTKGAPWTYCDGETSKSPDWGHIYSDAECDTLTLSLLKTVDAKVMACVGRALPDKSRAAFDSLAWNIGTGAFCASSIVTAAKQGDLIGACNRIDLYNRAGGKVIPGLVTRRGDERAVCLEGAVGQ